MPKTPQFVRVRIAVDDETPVLVGTTATMKATFTGIASIQLDPPERDPRRRRVDRPIVCPEVNPEAQCPFGVPLIPTKPGALGQLLNSAPELLERVSTLTARLTELLGDRNQNSIAAILENVQVISRNLAERSDEIAATLAEARIAIRQTGVAAEEMGQLADTTDQLPVARRPADDRRPQADDPGGRDQHGQSRRDAERRPAGPPGLLQADHSRGRPAGPRPEGNVGFAVRRRPAPQPQGAGGIIGGSKLPDYKPRKK